MAPEVGAEREEFEKALQDDLTAKLSIYKCPRRMYYVDDMPLTATGKLAKNRLGELFDPSGGQV